MKEIKLKKTKKSYFHNFHRYQIIHFEMEVCMSGFFNHFQFTEPLLNNFKVRWKKSVCQGFSTIFKSWNIWSYAWGNKTFKTVAFYSILGGSEKIGGNFISTPWNPG